MKQENLSSLDKGSADEYDLYLKNEAFLEIYYITLGLSLLFAIVTAIYSIILADESYHLRMVIVSGITTILFLWIGLTCKKSKLIRNSPHLFTFLITLLAYSNIYILLSLSGQVFWASYFGLLIISAGYFILSTGYFVILNIVCIYTYAAALVPKLMTEEKREWIYFGIVLLVSILIGSILHFVRRKLAKQNFILYNETRVQNEELQYMLSRIKHQEELFRDFLDNANDLIQMVNIEGKFVYVNRKWKETLGYNEEDLKKLQLKDIVVEEEIEHCQSLLNQVTQTPMSLNIETKFRAKNGKVILVEGNVNSRFENGKFISTRGIFRDITKRKEEEEKLLLLSKELDNLNKKLTLAYQEIRDEKDRLITLMSKEEMILLLNNKGIIIGVNENVLNTSGFSRKEIINKSIVDILDQNSREAVVEIFRNGFIGNYKIINGRFLLTSADDKEYMFLFHKLELDKERMFIVIVREILS